MALLNSLGLGNIFGQSTGSTGYPTRYLDMANQTQPQSLTQHQQQILQQQVFAQQYAYQQAQMQVTKNWMFNGKMCDVREMANEIWPKDCPDKTHFILKYE